MLDPRPDLAYDSKEWNWLLILANGQNLELAGNLHGLRCCGLRLHKSKDGYALRPDLDPDMSKWGTKEDYLQDRDRWLIPYAKEITEILREVMRLKIQEGG